MLNVVGRSLGRSAYIFATMLALAKNYYQYNQLDKLLSGFNRITQGEDVANETAASHYLLLESIFKRLRMFDEEDAVVAFNRKWRNRVDRIKAEKQTSNISLTRRDGPS
jgi:hypothetical protein